MPDLSRLKDNYQRVTDDIKSACARVGRNPADVRLMAVTKTVGPELIQALYDLGQRDFGENRIQVAVPKISKLAGTTPDAEWHFIGHLQRNKVKEATKVFSWIHSVDSPRLACELQKIAVVKKIKVKILLEVKTSEEQAKLGAEPEALSELIDFVLQSDRLELRGLMTMAPFLRNIEDTRPYFAKLRELRDNLKNVKGLILPELSMGMSNDYTVAIEEGATIVRIGTALFKGIE